MVCVVTYHYTTFSGAVHYFIFSKNLESGVNMSKLAKNFDAYSFQELCVDVLFDIYAEKFEVYGREGQTQNGIDLQSQTKVAQCKFYSDDSKNPYSRLITQIEKDYSTACQHFDFSEFIVITSLNRDIATQDTIKVLNDTEHTVSIIFWEDIEKVALNNKEILKLHFSSYLNSQDMSLLEQNQLIFKQRFLELFSRYDIYKLVTEPRLEANFDSSVFESFDALAEEYNYLIELCPRSSLNAFTSKPSFTQVEAKMWRSAWKCTDGKFTFFKILVN